MFYFLKLVMSFSSLRINSIEWDGDFLNVSGDGWSFSSSSAGRVSKDDDMLFACWDDQASVRIKVGRSFSWKCFVDRPESARRSIFCTF
jgi:hypothetical protein